MIKNNILVIAPHPDDELLGCGGTLLRRKAQGAKIGWVVVTAITEKGGWEHSKIVRRTGEIEKVRAGLGVDTQNLYQTGFPAAQLDQVPMGTLVAELAKIFKEFQPEEVYLPHPGDAHGDHRVVFYAASACTKWFRCPSIRRIFTYETLSETEAGLDNSKMFRPTSFVDISAYLNQKIELMGIYETETGEFPFPRSAEAIRALAKLRGAASGYQAAEAFEMLRERS